jgi:hypothetical protein
VTAITTQRMPMPKPVARAAVFWGPEVCMTGSILVGGVVEAQI